MPQGTKSSIIQPSCCLFFNPRWAEVHKEVNLNIWHLWIGGLWSTLRNGKGSWKFALTSVNQEGIVRGLQPFIPTTITLSEMERRLSGVVEISIKLIWALEIIAKMENTITIILRLNRHVCEHIKLRINSGVSSSIHCVHTEDDSWALAWQREREMWGKKPWSFELKKFFWMPNKHIKDK